MSKIAVYLAPYYHTVSTGLVRPYCLNYQNSSGELASTRFVYDKRGLNNRGFYQQVMGGRSSLNQHEFDSKNRLIRKLRDYNDGEKTEELFHYDRSGRLARESFESSSGARGTASYAYDKKGNAHRMDCEGYKGWLKARLDFTFDRDGKRLEGSISREGSPTGTISYKYDSDGNLILEEWEMEKGWSQVFQYVYEPVD